MPQLRYKWVLALTSGAILVSLSVLFGWALDIQVLKSVHPEWATK